MAVTENDLVVGPITPASGVKTISLDFYFERAEWIQVYKSGSASPLTLGVDYTVAGEGTSSGVVTLAVAADGVDSYSIYLSVPLSRSSDFQLRGEFKSDPLNLELDRIWQRLQYHWTVLGRKFGVSLTSGAVGNIEPEAGKVIGFDNDLALTLLGAASVFSTNDFPIFDTVSGMTAETGLAVGDKCMTLGYNAKGDGGGSFYEIVAAGTGTDDGLEYIDLSGISGQAKFLRTHGVAKPEIAGALGDGATDDTAKFLALASYLGRGMIETQDKSYVLDTLALTNCSIRGNGQLIAAAGASAVLSLEKDSAFGWRHRFVEGVTIRGNSKASTGITFGEGGDDRLAGRWTIDGAFIEGCDKCIEKPTGNIGNIIRSTSMRNSDFGYHSTGQTSPIMHGGADIIQGGEIAGMAKAAIYINSPQDGTGQLIIDGVVIENNAGFGVFVKSFGKSGAQALPLRLRDVWIEDTARAASVTIDGVSYTPRDLYFEDVLNAIVEGSQMREIELVDANVIFDGCQGNDLTNFTIDAGSYAVGRNLYLDGMSGQPLVVESIVASRRPNGTFATTLRCAPRTLAIKALPAGTAIIAQDFDGASTFNMGGTSTITSTQEADSILFDNCAEFTQPGGNTNVFGSASITAGKWYVYTLDFKQVSGAAPDIDIVQNQALARNLDRCAGALGEWFTLGGVCSSSDTGLVQFRFVNGSGANSVFRLSALQIIEFDDEQQAVDYFNNRFALVA